MTHGKKTAGRQHGTVQARLILYGVAAVALVALAVSLLRAGGRKPLPTPGISVYAPAPSDGDNMRRWDGWLTDIRSAASACGDGKDVLVEFTSRNDGGGQLEALLQNHAFALLRQRYVLVRLDVTSSHSDPATVERTAEWIDELNLTDLPCLVSFDPAFRPFGVVGGNDVRTLGDLLARIHALDGAKARRDSHLSAAAGAAGLERARLLDMALDDVGPVAKLGYPEVMRQIVSLDSDGTAGLKARYAGRVSDLLVDDGIQHGVYPLVDAGDLQGALEKASQLESGVATTVPQRQLLRAFQAQLYSSLGQKQKALAMMEDAVALDPSTDAATRVRSEKAKIEQRQ